MSDRVEKLTTIVLAVAAATIAATLVGREIEARGPGQFKYEEPNAKRPPEFKEGWTQILSAGVLIGNASAPVKIIEFTDFECPFCRRFNGVLRSVRRKHGSAVATWIVHFPLEDVHRFARPAARAAECARAHSRFSEMVDVIFDKQDSLGLKSWSSYAAEASVSDTASFKECISRSDSPQIVEAGVSVGALFGVQGTPTVLVNGWRYRIPPSEEELDRVVAAVLAGKEPFKSPK